MVPRPRKPMGRSLKSNVRPKICVAENGVGNEVGIEVENGVEMKVENGVEIGRSNFPRRPIQFPDPILRSNFFLAKW